jgi:hypothetical protein
VRALVGVAELLPALFGFLKEAERVVVTSRSFGAAHSGQNLKLPWYSKPQAGQAATVGAYARSLSAPNGHKEMHRAGFAFVRLPD